VLHDPFFVTTIFMRICVNVHLLICVKCAFISQDSDECVCVCVCVCACAVPSRRRHVLPCALLPLHVFRSVLVASLIWHSCVEACDSCFVSGAHELRGIEVRGLADRRRKKPVKGLRRRRYAAKHGPRNLAHAFVARTSDHPLPTPSHKPRLDDSLDAAGSRC